MDILKSDVSQQHAIMQIAAHSKTFRTIVGSGRVGVPLAEVRKFKKREPDELSNLLTLQMVEFTWPTPDRDGGGDTGDDDWQLQDVSPDGVELLDLDEPRMFRCSALGFATWRVTGQQGESNPSFEGLRESLAHVLKSQWQLHCKLDKVFWSASHPSLFMLRVMEGIWSDFVGLVSQDVVAIAKQHPTEMTEQNRRQLVRLRKVLETIEPTRLASPSDAATRAMGWLERLVGEWPLKIVVKPASPPQEAAPIRRNKRWTEAEANEWLIKLIRERKELSSTQIKAAITATGGPSWGTVVKTEFYQAYMTKRKRAKPKGERQALGKRVSLARAEDAVTDERDPLDQLEIERLHQEQQRDESDQRWRRRPPRGSTK
ncbi:MAG: hypothetical protein K2Y21_12535 [Phycisphaerales bacterium]|nr:hypothetical protein [Phycisphaerales bacterium]